MKKFWPLIVLACSPLLAGMSADEINAAHAKVVEDWISHCKSLPVQHAVVLERGGKEVAKPASLEAALKTAKNNDVVRLQNGVYLAAIVDIPAGVRIRGEGDDTIITGACANTKESWTKVIGEDSTVESVMFGIPEFATRSRAGYLWLEDVGNALGIPAFNAQEVYKQTKKPQTNVVRIFGHALLNPADPELHANFYVGYKRLDENDRLVSTSDSIPFMTPFLGFQKEVVDEYDYKMPVLPRKRAEKFVAWLASEGRSYQSAHPLGRKIVSHLVDYVTRKYPDIKLPADKEGSDAALAKAKEEIEKRHPLTARYFLEKADALSPSTRSQLEALRLETLTKGLGSLACAYDVTIQGGAEKMDAIYYKSDRHTKPLEEKLHKQFPILRMATAVDAAATCRIKITVNEELTETRSNTARASFTTWVESEASKQRRAFEASVAAAAARAAERSASQAAQARLDTMVSNAQANFRNLYDHRTRIEQHGGDTYVISYRDKNPGALGRSDAAAAKNAEDAASEARNARASADKAGQGAPGLEKKEGHLSIYNQNYVYTYQANVEVKDKGKDVLSAKNPSSVAKWATANCTDVSDSFQSACGDRRPGGTMAHTDDYFQQYVETPLVTFLTIRLGKLASDSLKSAEKKKSEGDKFESLLQAYLVGGPITDKDIEPYTEKVLGEKIGLDEIGRTILR